MDIEGPGQVHEAIRDLGQSIYDLIGLNSERFSGRVASDSDSISCSGNNHVFPQIHSILTHNIIAFMPIVMI